MAKHRRFYIDMFLGDETPIESGDVLLGPKACYRVLEAHPTESRIWANRWTVDVLPLGAYEGLNPPPPAPGRSWLHIDNGGRRGMGDI